MMAWVDGRENQRMRSVSVSGFVHIGGHSVGDREGLDVRSRGKAADEKPCASSMWRAGQAAQAQKSILVAPKLTDSHEK